MEESLHLRAVPGKWSLWEDVLLGDFRSLGLQSLGLLLLPHLLMGSRDLERRHVKARGIFLGLRVGGRKRLPAFHGFGQLLSIKIHGAPLILHLEPGVPNSLGRFLDLERLRL